MNCYACLLLTYITLSYYLILYCILHATGICKKKTKKKGKKINKTDKLYTVYIRPISENTGSFRGGRIRS